jgi:20S proteasome alpha/beta subunit
MLTNTATASQTVKKVIEINSVLLGTMAGGAADCQYWYVYRHLFSHPLQTSRLRVMPQTF